MKKRMIKLKLIGILCLSLWMTGWSGVFTVHTFAAAAAPPELISNLFPDANLAFVVANQLGVSTSTTVDQTMLDQITSLFAINQGIVNLTGIGYLKKLQYLDVSNNLITSIPQELSSVSTLKSLILSSNKLTVLPSSVFGNFPFIQRVMLDGNRLEDLTELDYLPGSCVKVCTGQILTRSLGEINTSSPITQTVQLPKIFNGQSVSVSSINSKTTPTISTDASGNKILNIPIDAVGANTVTARIEGGIANYTTYAVSYTVVNPDTLKIPVINSALNNTFSSSLKPYVYGKGIPGNSVMVLTDGKEDSNLVVVNGAGDWGYTPAANLTASKHVFTAKAKDITNAWSAVSASVTITIDTTAPAKPVITSSLNNSTTNNVRVPITGTAEAAAFITLYIDGVEYQDCTKADTTGKWSYTPVSSLSAGSHTFTAKAKDAVGNISGVSTTVTITVDTSAPLIPAIDVAINNATLKLSKPVITGTGDIGSKITVYLDSLASGNPVVVDTTGKWKFTATTALLDGNHTVYAIAKDSAGNASSSSAIYNFSTDTVAPAAPSISTPVNNQITNIPKPEFAGKADLNTSVIIYVNGKAISPKITVDGSGSWTFTPTTAITDGALKITAKAFDAAGNESPASTILALTIKTAPPPKPVIDTKLNNLVTNNNRPIISGTAEAKAFITVNIDGNDIVDCAQADATGKWAYTPGFLLADGKRTLSARAKDTFNNVGAFSTNVTINIDTVPPSIPVIDATFNGALLNSLKPEITGTCDPTEAVFVLVDGTAGTKSVKADATGKWKYTVDIALGEGAHQISAKSVDTAGNASPISGAYPVTINVTPPNIPRILQPGNNLTTNDNKILISGVADLNAKVILYLNNTELAQIDTDGNGAWSYKPTDAIKDGSHKVTAKARNKANNISAASAPIVVIIDTTAPKAPVVTSPTNSSVTSSQKISVSGTAEAGTKITVKVDGIVYADCAAADSTGKWSFVLPDLLALGTHSISASAKDSMNNAGDFGNAIGLIVDTTAPIVTVDEIGSGNMTNSASPQITGSVKANSKVYLKIDDKAVTNAIMADNEGKWKYKISAKLVEGSHSVIGTAVDSAGNASAAPTVVKFIVDLTAPAKPEIKNANPKDKTVTNNPNPEVSGKCEPNTNVVFYVDNKLQEDITQSDAEGNWTVQLANTLEDGKHAIYAKAKDAAGNTSDKSEVLNLVVDTMPPKTPVITSPKNGTNFKSTKIAVKGIGESGAELILSVDDTAVELTQKLNAKGEFSYVLDQSLKTGKHVIAVTTKDEAQNISATTTAAITIGTIPKVTWKAPVVMKPTNKSKTKDKKPLLSGTAMPNTKVNVSLKTSRGKTLQVLAITSSKNGAWSVKPPKNLVPGSYQIVAAAKDLKGKLTAGKTITITIMK